MANVKRDELKLALMDFDEEWERYKQVKSVNGGGTRHLSIDKNETVADIKVMAENLFFPQGHSKNKTKVFHTIQLILRAHRYMLMCLIQYMSCITKAR